MGYSMMGGTRDAGCGMRLKEEEGGWEIGREIRYVACGGEGEGGGRILVCNGLGLGLGWKR